jgi:8-oxo-dGTP pyrophosphatase MutT (NUDIX family)
MPMMYFPFTVTLWLVFLFPFAWASSPSQQTIPVGSRPAFVREGDATSTDPLGYEVLEENVLHSKWRILYQRLVRMPNGNIVDFEVVGQKGSGAAIVFAWDSSTKTATLCREYHPGPNQILCGLAAGIIEDKHDADPRTAAEHELEEEVHLSGGTWHSLLESPLAMDKYATTRVHAYLVIDAQRVANPRPLDDEEEIEILTNVSVDEIKRMIRQGEMNIVGGWAALLAIEKLRDLGEIS